MAHKKTGFIVTYLVTVIVAIVLLGGTAIIVYKEFVEKSDDVEIESSSEEELLFTPDEDQNQTMLFILDAGDAKTDDIFILTRFLPTEEQLICIPIPGEMYAQIGTVKSTVYEFHRTGGASKAVEAVQSALNIPVQKYMKFGKDSFNNIVDILGGLNYNIPYDMEYENPDTGEKIILNKGNQFLDGNKIRQLITFPEYQEGENYRVKITGAVFTQLINQSLSERLANNLDTSFNSIINTVETNINAYDYQFRKDAIEYLIQPGTNPAVVKNATGEYNEDGQFVIENSFKEDVLYWFKTDAVVK